MTRFTWAAWGLLVVVLDLPFHGWDVLPDVVGYAWVVIGLAGGAGLHPGLVRARAAAAAGIPVALVVGTPLFGGSVGLLWGATFVGVLVFVVVVHQLATAIRDLDPVPGDSDQRRWASGLRVAAPVAGAVQLVGLVLLGTPVGIVFLVGMMAVVLVGVVTVVLLQRVDRAGWLASATTATSATTPTGRE